MLKKYNDYLSYELPNNWQVETKEENTIIYNPNGIGAMTISSFSILPTSKSLDEQISVMAKNFIDINKVHLENPLIIVGSEITKLTLSGYGTTKDNWFVKIWVVAKKPKIVFASYQSKEKGKEIIEYDKIINSMKFEY